MCECIHADFFCEILNISHAQQDFGLEERNLELKMKNLGRNFLENCLFAVKNYVLIRRKSRNVQNHRESKDEASFQLSEVDLSPGHRTLHLSLRTSCYLRRELQP